MNFNQWSFLGNFKWIIFLGIMILTLMVGMSQRQVKKLNTVSPNSLQEAQDSITISNQALISELGCNACHNGLGSIPIDIQNKAPDFTFAGDKYQPSFLFDYLQNPTKVRHHIGHSRMPDFKLSPEERLALTLYLSEQKGAGKAMPKFPEIGKRGLFKGEGGDAQNGQFLIEKLTCLTCHTIAGKGNKLVLDLDNSVHRLNEDWVKKYLVAPNLFNGPNNIMPSFFYKIREDSSEFEQLIDSADQYINDIVSYIFSLRNTNGAKEKSYQAFKKANRNITSKQGAQIFKAMNCGGCHKASGQSKSDYWFAPDLQYEMASVQTSWLKNYLSSPKAIRPFGGQPGMGGRMPDYHLTQPEIDRIIQFLSTRDTSFSNFTPRRLSAFSMKKAHQLLEDKMACLGCHELNGKGGRLGPSLTKINTRLQPEYLYQMIKSPQELAKGTIMPKIPLPEKNLDLIVNYLWQLNGPETETEYFSLIENPPYLLEDIESTERDYLTYCSGCHGEGGNGVGFNATYLADAPTAHNDSEYMTLRPDDTLFDGIYSGGYILNKSHLMPQWGQTLSPETIQDLVAYMRKLCNCNGPKWSLDN